MSTLDGFLPGLGRYLISCWGFVFTIGGTLAGILLGGLAGWAWWIALMIVVANALGCGLYAYSKYRGEMRAKADLKGEQDRLTSEHHATARKLAEAEQKLNEVPLELLARVSRIVESVSLGDLARLLAACAEIINRQKQFVEVASKALALTTFSRQGEQLYALAKAPTTALQHLHIGDPFLLQKKTPSGLELEVARLKVHQAPDLKKEVAYFVILSPVTPELEAMANLADHGDVAGVKGYSIRSAFDVSRYAAFDLASIPEAIALLIEDAARRLPGATP